MDKMQRRRAPILGYAVICSTVIAAALAFIQVAVLFTPQTVGQFSGFAVIYALFAAPIGAVSGVLAGFVARVFLLVVEAEKVVARTERASMWKGHLAVAGGLAIGSLPGLAVAIWLTGQFALEQHSPTPLQWIEFAVALVGFSAGGVVLLHRSNKSANKFDEGSILVCEPSKTSDE